MYVFYCGLIWLLVYLLPGLAFFPQLMASPTIAFALPIVSAFIIYSFSSLLLALGIFDTTSVLILALTLGSIGVFRTFRLWRESAFSWTKQAIGIYVLQAILLFPYFVKLGTHAFDRGDEIYSWNFWAIQHYFQETIDFSHTGAPYPQLFPKLLAFCYHLVGNIDLQLPTKATLIIFPWAMLTAIATVAWKRFGALKGAFWMLWLAVLMLVGLGQFFDDGYADPIMTSGLIISIVLLWFSQKGIPARLNSIQLAALSVLCAVMAAHTKQVALLWTLFSLPVILCWAAFQKRDWRLAALALLSVTGGLWWVLGEGNTFHHNTGVLSLSWSDRDLVSQLAYSANKYFVQQPALFLLFVFAIWASFKEVILRRIVLLFMIPSLLCWFLMGAYQLRLGQHLIALAYFLWVASGQMLPSFGRFESRLKPMMVGAMALSLCLGIGLFVREQQKGLNLYEGGKQSLLRYFGQDTDLIYQHIYADPQSLVWVPSRYLYGLFYKRTRLLTPDYSNYGVYDHAALIDELQRKSPDYVFTVSQAIMGGPASELLKEIIAQCPVAFEHVSGPQSKFSFETYKINKPLLQQDPCLVTLVSNKGYDVQKLKAGA